MSSPEQYSHLLPDHGHAVRARGDLYIFKVRAAQTDGHYSLFEARNLGGGGVPLHYHTLDEETFYVLEGTYAFQVGDKTVTASQGECLHIPRPLPHAFQNVGEKPGRLLVVISPGGNHERYFDEAWESAPSIDQLPAEPDPPDFARVGKALQKAGMSMLEPVPSATS
jgi:mannose-6-phosphate isomerase-like protein (cupin superfamily)